MKTTPNSNRLHLVLLGKRNSGKSSLLNALTAQEVSLVSEVPGTTTDPVQKPMEIHGLGAVNFVDTAGFDDDGVLGDKRVQATKKALQKADMAILVCASEHVEEELLWLKYLESKDVPCVVVLNKIDELPHVEGVMAQIYQQLKRHPIGVSALHSTNILELQQALVKAQPSNFERESIVGKLVEEGDVVLLVMPQDIQAPKGRLILPQVQTIRDLLDKRCLVMSCTTDQLQLTLSALKKAPKLIITDSQVFHIVMEQKPKDSLLTSFSVLFGNYKGDINFFMEGARTIGTLNAQSRVLIAEACTHAPLQEDIGREKIPHLLRKLYGEGMQIDLVAGTDFPEDLSPYDLIIHCGACMFTRKYVMNRIERVKAQKVPMTNYGVSLAYLHGILDSIVVNDA